jgi:hypothetical protein
MSHDKVIRGQKATIDQLQYEIMALKQQMEAVATKLHYQTQYLQQLHSQIKR